MKPFFMTLMVALVSVMSAKDHFIVEEPMENEHALVKATQSQICELCFFDDSEISSIPSNNKFCLTMTGS